MLLICEQNRFFSLYLDRLKNKLVDGIVLFYSGMEAQQLSSLAQNSPIVQCCEIVPDSHTSTVSIGKGSPPFCFCLRKCRLGNAAA